MHAIAVSVTEPSQSGDARRAAQTLATSVGFDAERAGKVALVATEAANNLHLHGKGGELLLRKLDAGGVGGIELIALDRGPGMADVDRCMVDGYSSAGTGGVGLGAMARQSDEFDVFSAPKQGTAILMRFWARPRPPLPAGSEPLCVSVVNIPAPGEEVSGDNWGFRVQREGGRFLVVDGLGHGSGAATASLEARRTFEEEATLGLVDLLHEMHGRMRHTRGAAAAVAEVDLGKNEIRYAGVGNIVSAVVARGVRTNLVSMNGTVGHQLRTVQQFVYPWPADGILVMHSDGIATSWSLEKYPGITQRHPSLIAALLYRDFRRGRDDASVLVVKSSGSVSAWRTPPRVNA